MKSNNLFEELFIKNKYQYVPIVGATGRGKTTLLKVLFSQRISNGCGALFITSRGVGDELQEILSICKNNKRANDVILLDFTNNNDDDIESITINIKEIVNSNKILIINYCGIKNKINSFIKNRVFAPLIENCTKPKETFMIFIDKSWKQEENFIILDILSVLRSTNIHLVVSSNQIIKSNAVKEQIKEDENIEIFLKTDLPVGQGILLKNGRENKFSFEKL